MVVIVGVNIDPSFLATRTLLLGMQDGTQFPDPFGVRSLEVMVTVKLVFAVLTSRYGTPGLGTSLKFIGGDVTSPDTDTGCGWKFNVLGPRMLNPLSLIIISIGWASTVAALMAQSPRLVQKRIRLVFFVNFMVGD